MMLDAVRWDADLIHRYDQDGPRYSAYPTPLQFNCKLGSFDLLHALRSSRQAARPLSLYVHLPFCADISSRCQCNKVIAKDRGRALSYLTRLEKEIELIGCHLSPEQVVQQLHFGGGTPTLLGHAELRRLMSHLRKHFNLQNDDHGDFSIDIDPREADWPMMGLLRELGFNRINIGLQNLDPDVQQAINRSQTMKQTQTVIEAARTLQFRSIRIDLTYGSPLQTPERFAHMMAGVIALQPERVSVASYAHLPERYVAQRKINPAELPTQPDKLTMLQHSVEQLTSAGYRYIGMDLFALPDDELAMAQEDGALQRGFHGYTTHGHCDLVGLGVSAISQIGDLYCQNNSDITLYQQSLGQGQLATIRGLRCNEDDRIRRYTIQALFCNFELRFDEIESIFGVSFKSHFEQTWPALEQMAADGLIQLNADAMTILPAGRLLAHAVCMQFDQRLPPRPASRFPQAM